MPFISNPPWSNKLIEANRAEIEEAGLPMPTDNELGTGRYGSVYETEDPGVVFKITSDPTEAAFIKRATEIGDWPKGIVRYRAIIDLEGKRYKRETYGIWREASIEVGLRTAQFRGHEYSRREEQDISEFSNYLEHFRNAAAIARDAIKKDPSLLQEALSDRAVRWAWDSIGTAEAMPRLSSYGGVSRKASDQPLSRYRGYQRIAAALRACGLLAELMEHTDMSSAVGGALGFYLEHNILLADVHAGNVGKVVREDPGYADLTYWVITDPGHAVLLDDLGSPVANPGPSSTKGQENVERLARIIRNYSATNFGARFAELSKLEEHSEVEMRGSKMSSRNMSVTLRNHLEALAALLGTEVEYFPASYERSGRGAFGGQRGNRGQDAGAQGSRSPAAVSWERSWRLKNKKRG